MKVIGGFFVTGAVLAGMLLFSAPASATTFCVPGFFADCPNNGTNIGMADFSIAATSNASDGQPDTIMLDAVDFVSVLPMEASGSDDLTVIGQGRDKSSISTSASSNSYVLITNPRSGLVTMKDMAIIVPASFPDSGGNGSALQSRQDVFENVDLISENPGSSGASSTLGGGTFTNVRVFGRNGGTIDRAFDAGCGDDGLLEINGAEITTSGVALNAQCGNIPFVVDRSKIKSDSSALSASSGGNLTVTNSVIEGGDFSPVNVYNAKGVLTSVGLDHVTVVAVGDNTQPVIRAQVANVVAATGNIVIGVRNSIVAGYQSTWELTAPTANDRGNIVLGLAYSNFAEGGLATGDATTDTATGNIFDNPGFEGITDYHLAPGSTSVDAGDPNQTDPILDFEGNARPIDGNYDDVAVRDMGAYELNPPPPSCPQDPSLCPNPVDKTAPKLSKVKFRFRVGKGGAIRYRVSEASKIRIVLRPVPAGKGKKKRKVVKINRGNRKGPGVIRLGKRKLKAGKYRLVIRATDKAGNTSKPIVRKVRAKG